MGAGLLFAGLTGMGACWLSVPDDPCPICPTATDRTVPGGHGHAVRSGNLALVVGATVLMLIAIASALGKRAGRGAAQETPNRKDEAAE